MFRAVFVPAGLLLVVSGHVSVSFRARGVTFGGLGHVLGCFCVRRVTLGGTRACFGLFSCPQHCFGRLEGIKRAISVLM